MLKLRKGFTLIELLIVVVIIGILAAIAIPKFANTKGKAYITAMKSDLRNLVTAEEAFFSDSSKYAKDTLTGMKFAPSTGVNFADDRDGCWLLVGDGDPHAAGAAISCAIAMNTTNPLVATAGEGEPVCK